MSIDKILAWVMLGLGFVGSFCSAILIVAALQKPRIGALTERAVLGVLLALFAIVAAISALNTDANAALFPVEVARVLVRILIIALEVVPVAWVYLYLTGRLGGDSE